MTTNVTGTALMAPKSRENRPHDLNENWIHHGNLTHHGHGLPYTHNVRCPHDSIELTNHPDTLPESEMHGSKLGFCSTSYGRIMS